VNRPASSWKVLVEPPGVVGWCDLMPSGEPDRHQRVAPVRTFEKDGLEGTAYPSSDLAPLRRTAWH
jgi:hypothetical protein